VVRVVKPRTSRPNAIAVVVGLMAVASCREPRSAPRASTNAGTPHPTNVTADGGAPFLQIPQHTGVITGARARELLAHGASLVDVRSPDDFAAGHLPGAMNIPVELVWRRYTEIPPGIVVVYCATGSRSARARRILGAFGREAYDLGPMSNW
jgi:phage shock protein E